MGQGMLNRHSFTQGLSAFWNLLTLTQFHEQSFIGMNAHTTPFGSGGAWRLQKTLRTSAFGEVNHTTRHKRHLLPCWTPDSLPFPIAGKGLLRKALPLA